MLSFPFLKSWCQVGGGVVKKHPGQVSAVQGLSVTAIYSVTLYAQPLCGCSASVQIMERKNQQNCFAAESRWIIRHYHIF